ncbi:MAG TPA: benzoate-CoA ligase family protein [Jatrophihabitans sp.]|jgi:benzoate-CoA ligase family protein|uniref:benzoate-CoA ligase family protein n=1 Tax=Jatrophihabitans sp. TaxID=1932789 RepID=UPI002E0C1385|nr:benzoate-CoA ligase family protein [Jatrophihabitans sp.]
MAELFNASVYLLDRRLEAGDGDRLALTGVGGDLTYARLHERVLRAAAGLRAIGLQPEQRVLMFMADSPEFVIVYLAAMRMGAVPVPVSTMTHADGLAELLRDSRARLLAVTREFGDLASSALKDAPEVAGVLAGPGAEVATGLSVHALDELDGVDPNPYDTSADSPAFWLYTSGTTGLPKGAMHRHGSIRHSCETYGTEVLGITRDDRSLSVAKAFFAYGLGNSVLFPLSVGAAAVLEPAPSRPDVIAERARQYGATLFFGGPTFFANMLRAGLPADALGPVRMAASAGEALPASLYTRWTEHFGVEILDGIGMTEMLHIFLSNRPGQVRPGTTGVAVPGYDLRILDDDGREVGPGTPGTLFVRGDSTAIGYWSRYDASRQVFQGEWLRTGDTYIEDADGYYACLGRTGDMLKASGIWVSPAEVETRLLAHDAVAQAVVVAAADLDGLEKPVAYVLLHEGRAVAEDELIAFCREGLPSFKRPRKVVFVDAYPTTATGKIRRVELRAMAATALVEAPVEQPVGGLHWQREDAPRWDTHKQSVFGPTELASVGLTAPAAGAAIADEWWQVVDDAGTILGYGWLDSEWGDAQISFLVVPDRRRAGVGGFIVGRLEREAAARGLNYIYNQVPPGHPDRAWMTAWLTARGFQESSQGDLRRRVGAVAPAPGTA